LGHDEARYQFDRTFAMAELASDARVVDPQALHDGLSDADGAVRYWAATGLLVRGAESVRSETSGLMAALRDTSPDVRIVAAEALAAHGSPEERLAGLAELQALAGARRQNVFTAVSAWNALDALGQRAESTKRLLRSSEPLLEVPPHARYAEYVQRLRQGEN
jgi:uncharacterized sulfatase